MHLLLVCLLTHHMLWAKTWLLRWLLLLRVLILAIVLASSSRRHSSLIVNIFTVRAGAAINTLRSSSSSWTRRHVARGRLLPRLLLMTIGRLLERSSLATGRRHSTHPLLIVAWRHLIHVGVWVATSATIHLLLVLWRSSISRRLLSGCRATIVGWHAHGSRHRVAIIIILRGGRRWRHTATIASVVAALGSLLSILLILLLLLLGLLLTELIRRSIGRVAVLSWLPFLCCVAEADLTRQNICALHTFNALVRSLVVCKFDEAEAFRVLCHWVNYDFRVKAVREILFECSQEHLTVDIGVEVSHVDLGLTASGSPGGSTLATSGHKSAALCTSARASLIMEAGTGTTTTHSVCAVHTTHFWRVHPRSTPGSDSSTTHATLSAHNRFFTWNWFTSSVILLVSASSMRRPIQLVIALRTLDRLTVQISKHAFSDLVRWEFDKAIADRLALELVSNEFYLLDDGKL